MDFIILKVNGKDMSHASHEEALQAFLEAQEPIIVHVLRRSSSRNTHDPPLIPDDKAISTNNGHKSDELSKQSARRSCICPRCGYNSAPLSPDTQDQEEVTSSGVESPYGYNNQQADDDEGAVYKVELKLTLARGANQSAMGVHCRNLYTSRDQAPVVIVDEVVNEHSRDRDTIRKGDQILEVNGVMVESSEHVDELFADPRRNQFDVLVARFTQVLEDGESVEELRMSHLEELYEHSEGAGDEEAFDESFNAHEKDSGLAESCRNDDSSENELVLSPRSSKYNTTSSGGCDDLEELISVREAGIQTEPNMRSLPTRSRGSLTSLESELLAVTLQMENIQRQCERVQETPLSTFRNLQVCSPRSSQISSLPVVNPRLSNLTAFAQEQVNHVRPAKQSNREKQSHKAGSTAHLSARPGVVKMPSPEFCEKAEESSRVRPSQPRLTRAAVEGQGAPAVINGVAIHLPYGSLPNAVPMRQLPRKNNGILRTVREDEELSSTKSGHIYEQIKTPSPVSDLHGSLTRSSGTRSSASKKPMRNKLLHERANHIAKERCGITTDDDAMSEFKGGRYWSKDERRQQLESSKDFKRRRELEKIRQQLSAQEAITPKIVTLSHQKILKRQVKNPDDFTTPEELEALKARLASETRRRPAQVSVNSTSNMTTV